MGELKGRSPPDDGLGHMDGLGNRGLFHAVGDQRCRGQDLFHEIRDARISTYSMGMRGSRPIPQ